jgi:nucleotide-binding universal stress UspA family protein
MAPTRIEIDRVLCPVDFSEFSSPALERALRLGLWFDARVEVLHVIPMPVPVGAGLPFFPAPLEVSEGQREQAARRLTNLVAPYLGEGVPIETRVLQGDPGRLIQEEAESLPADLLVMGTHGRSGFEHLLLGSVTEKVLRRAPCPVLTVGPVAAHPRVGPLFRRILAAADLTQASEHTLDVALSLATENDAQITLLHVVETLPGTHLPMAVPELGPMHRDLVAQSRADLRKVVPEAARSFCEVTERVEAGTPWSEILRVASQMDADLIVMGAHTRGALERMFFGSTACQVVRRASCPVLVIHETTPTAPTASDVVEARGSKSASHLRGAL